MLVPGWLNDEGLVGLPPLVNDAVPDALELPPETSIKLVLARCIASESFEYSLSRACSKRASVPDVAVGWERELRPSSDWERRRMLDVSSSRSRMSSTAVGVMLGEREWVGLDRADKKVLLPEDLERGLLDSEKERVGEVPDELAPVPALEGLDENRLPLPLCRGGDSCNAGRVGRGGRVGDVLELGITVEMS